jgi:LPS-assembly lipoprotein
MIGRRLLLLGAGAPLTGCGFQPIYMKTASGQAGPAQRELAAVFVPVIAERPGQVLRQALQDHLGNDSGTKANYDLQVNWSIAGEGIAVESNSIATRVRFTGNASWSLIARDDKHTKLTTGSARVLDGLNIFDGQYFASDMQTEVVEARMAEVAAQQITTQLAIWFRQRAGKQTAG